jgi:hypothetical protein
LKINSLDADHRHIHNIVIFELQFFRHLLLRECALPNAYLL